MTKTLLQQNEDLIATLENDGTIKRAVLIYLFLKNAREAAFENGKQQSEIVQGIGGYYWVLEDRADARRLREAGYEVISAYYLGETEGLSVTHEPKLKAVVELDPLGSVIFKLGDGKKIRCEIEKHKDGARLKVSDASVFGALSMRPEASNVLTITCVSLFS